MNEYPKKLIKYLGALPPEKREENQQFYRKILAQAVEHGFQSPKFWATRQIITGLNAGQIQHKIQQRLRQTLNTNS